MTSIIIRPETRTLEVGGRFNWTVSLDDNGNPSGYLVFSDGTVIGYDQEKLSLVKSGFSAVIWHQPRALTLRGYDHLWAARSDEVTDGSYHETKDFSLPAAISVAHGILYVSAQEANELATFLVPSVKRPLSWAEDFQQAAAKEALRQKPWLKNIHVNSHSKIQMLNHLDRAMQEYGTTVRFYQP